MIIEHYGTKGMKWGERKAVSKALSPKGHSERLKRHSTSRELKVAKRFQDMTDRMVASSLANPTSMVTIKTPHYTLTANGRDFAEHIIGRVGDASLAPRRTSAKSVTRHGR